MSGVVLVIIKRLSELRSILLLRVEKYKHVSHAIRFCKNKRLHAELFCTKEISASPKKRKKESTVATIMERNAKKKLLVIHHQLGFEKQKGKKKERLGKKDRKNEGTFIIDDTELHVTVSQAETRT